jgi:hypothetical protein
VTKTVNTQAKAAARHLVQFPTWKIWSVQARRFFIGNPLLKNRLSMWGKGRTLRAQIGKPIWGYAPSLKNLPLRTARGIFKFSMDIFGEPYLWVAGLRYGPKLSSQFIRFGLMGTEAAAGGAALFYWFKNKAAETTFDRYASLQKEYAPVLNAKAAGWLDDSDLENIAALDDTLGLKQREALLVYKDNLDKTEAKLGEVEEKFPEAKSEIKNLEVEYKGYKEQLRAERQKLKLLVEQYEKDKYIGPEYWISRRSLTVATQLLDGGK